MILDEERHAAFAVLIGYTPSLNAEDRREVVALVTVSGLVQAVFGYPNEEAVWKDPRGDLAGGIDEIAGSRWAQNINESNRRSFGADYNWRAGRPPRHFFVGSKDATAQFLAYDLLVEVFVDARYKEVFAEALCRLDT